MRPLVTVLLASCFSSLAGIAQPALQPMQDPQPIPPRLTLELALQLVLDSNPTLLAERHNVAIARASAVDAGQWPNPTLSYDAEKVGGSAAADASFWNDQDLVVRMQQRIPVGGKRRSLRSAARQGIAAAGETLRDTVRRLTLEAQRRYYAVVLARQELDLATEVLDQFDRIVELTKLRYEQGEASGLELSRVETERLRFFSDRVVAEAELSNAKISMLELLGGDTDADFEVAERLRYEPLETDEDGLVEAALENRPDLAAQRFRVGQSREREAYERALRIPDLVPYVGYNRDLGENSLAFGIAVDIPLFYRNEGGIARAAAETGRERETLRAVELLVRRGVGETLNLVRAQARLVEAMDAEYVPSARLARNIAQASYSLGALDLIAFLDAERSYRETLRGYYRTLYDYQISRFVLEAVIGVEVT